MEASPVTRRAGRRAGGADTRSEVLAAARAEFATNGFDRTTMRAVAAAAGVDAALVHHYFGSKDDLFVAALELPIDPRVLIPKLLSPGLDGLAQRVLHTLLSVWDDPTTRMPLLALVRSGLSSQQGAELLRNGMFRMIFEPLTQALGGEDAPVRAQLAASQLLGLITARYVLELEPLASLPAEEVVRRVAPSVQRYLTPSGPGEHISSHGE